MAFNSSLNLDQDPCAIIAVRELAALRELVFAVWTDPKHLAQWWGPIGFTTTPSAFDLTRGWRVALCRARAGRPRLPKSHHLRGD